MAEPVELSKQDITREIGRLQQLKRVHWPDLVMVGGYPPEQWPESHVVA